MERVTVEEVTDLFTQEILAFPRVLKPWGFYDARKVLGMDSRERLTVGADGTCLYLMSCEDTAALFPAEITLENYYIQMDKACRGYVRYNYRVIDPRPLFPQGNIPPEDLYDWPASLVMKMSEVNEGVRVALEQVMTRMARHIGSLATGGRLWTTITTRKWFIHSHLARCVRGVLERLAYWARSIYRVATASGQCDFYLQALFSLTPPDYWTIQLSMDFASDKNFLPAQDVYNFFVPKLRKALGDSAEKVPASCPSYKAEREGGAPLLKVLVLRHISGLVVPLCYPAESAISTLKNLYSGEYPAIKAEIPPDVAYWDELGDRPLRPWDKDSAGEVKK